MRPIDEDDVKRAIRKVKRDWMLCTTKETETALKVVEGALTGCRTIELVKRAKWVQPDDSPMGCLVCSNCLTYPISKNGRWVLSKYCPNCGEKMEE